MKFINEKIKNKGFTLLVSVVTTSILILVSFVVANIALKQLTISFANQESQYAFYNADSGTECAIYWDLKNSSSSFDPYVIPSAVTCNNQSMTPVFTSISGGYSTSTFQFNLPRGCVVVEVAKKVGLGTTTIINSHGYNTCSLGSLRKFERGVVIKYNEVSLPPPIPGPWALTVTKAGAGTGTVTGNGINCGATCSSILADGTLTSLTATPSGSNTFTGWSGACSGVGFCVTSMTSDKSVTATFGVPAPGPWTLTVTKAGSGSGTVTGNGINCGATCSSILADGTVTSLTATPSGSDIFIGWSGACSGVGSCVTTMSSSKSATATFGLLPTGGTITTAGGYRIHTFTSGGTFNTGGSPINVDYLIVAGGAGGGHGASSNHGGGGGGCGPVLNGSTSLSAGSYGVSVGGGGAGSVGISAGSNGGNSSIASISTAIGGGGGGNGQSAGTMAGQDGGCGGGAGGVGTPVAGIGSQGGNGGAGPGGKFDGAGGGGALPQVGADGSTQGFNPAGGAGRTSSISGSSVTYGTGGNGGNSKGVGVGVDGTFPGDGGDGGDGWLANGANGGSGAAGIVIIRYLYP